jgi:hypothetical protein
MQGFCVSCRTPVWGGAACKTTTWLRVDVWSRAWCHTTKRRGRAAGPRLPFAVPARSLGALRGPARCPALTHIRRRCCGAHPCVVVPPASASPPSALPVAKEKVMRSRYVNSTDWLHYRSWRCAHPLVGVSKVWCERFGGWVVGRIATTPARLCRGGMVRGLSSRTAASGCVGGGGGMAEHTHFLLRQTFRRRSRSVGWVVVCVGCCLLRGAARNPSAVARAICRRAAVLET